MVRLLGRLPAGPLLGQRHPLLGLPADLLAHPVQVAEHPHVLGPDCVRRGSAQQRRRLPGPDVARALFLPQGLLGSAQERLSAAYGPAPGCGGADAAGARPALG